jgi:hypothetical protein
LKRGSLLLALALLTFVAKSRQEFLNESWLAV